MFRIHWIFGVIGMLAAVSAGCGGSANSYPVSGVVTYDGKPLEGASVLFIPQQGSTGMGTTDSSGKYEISTAGKPGAPLGKYDVTISKTIHTGAPKPENPTPEDMAKMAASKEGISYKSVIPQKYGTPRGGSGLSATVTENGEKNVFDFSLTP